ncbi:FtsW/RodA/SpoVE family cell cycle protein [Bacillus sp. SM2101]|uniref:FtsW/RodA/SpoVE family cell cycle protein n=1 Tax=Bacillaceae TaxID=186817 RepID=UPI001BDEC4D6|nr:FtsW/RodA/SpoVE family cell cycle protein [Bacillus sp. SM2101]
MIKKMFKSYDYSIVVAVLLLSVFGLLMIYSSSTVISVTRYDEYTGGQSDFFFQQQKKWLIIGFIAFLSTMIFPYKAYASKKILQGIVLGIIALLIFVFFLGHTAGNAQSWLKLGIIRLQPSEFAKMAVIIYLAAAYSKKQSYINQFDRAVLPPIIFVGFICILVVLQPDIGTATIIAMIATTIIMSSGMGIKNLIKLGMLALAGLILITPIFVIFSNQIFTEKRLGRLYGYLDPFANEDIVGGGYQLVNSYIAIGLGGLNGLGLGESIQKFGYLPESHTDFIMAIIAEELGLFGVTFVLFLLLFIILKGFLIARKSNDPFGSLLAIGISSMIGIQTFINLGGVTGLIPITGVPLPFISYGGSSFLLLMISMGILVNISMFVNRQLDKPQEMNEQPIKHQQTFRKPISY